jgi:hypothetical protein
MMRIGWLAPADQAWLCGNEFKMHLVANARNLSDLKAPPANRLEALKKDRKGQHSIRINDQWRDGNAYDVEIVDYHLGKKPWPILLPSILVMCGVRTFSSRLA